MTGSYHHLVSNACLFDIRCSFGAVIFLISCFIVHNLYYFFQVAVLHRIVTFRAELKMFFYSYIYQKYFVRSVYMVQK